jgi:carbamoyl-phosphate synthase large subunit
MLNLKNKRIFISGGSGIIGIELINILHNKGAEIFVGDLKKKPKQFDKKVKYFHGDLNNITKNDLTDFNPDYFIHLAATFERTEESLDFFIQNKINNNNLSSHLINILKDFKNLKTIIFASSYLVYDSNKYEFLNPQYKAIKINERFQLRSRNLIGASKLYHESELEFFRKFYYKKNFVIFRIFRGYGLGSQDVISRWVRNLLRNEKEPIKLYKPEGMFDYVFSRDVARAIVCSLENSQKSNTYNIGFGKARKVIEIIKILKKYFPQLRFKLIKSNIPYEASEADTSLANKKILWQPIYNLEKGIKEIIKYESNIIKKEKRKKYGNFLITSCSNKLALIKNFKNALDRISPEIQFYLCDNDANSIAKYFYKKNFFTIKKIHHIKKNQLIKILKSKNIKYIFPTGHYELLYWANLKIFLEKKGIKVLVLNSRIIKKCLDKLEFSRFGIKNKLNIVPSYSKIEECKDSKIVIKERYGFGSKNTFLNISRSDYLKSAKYLKDPIIQPYIKGKEFSSDIWISKDRKTIAISLRYRIKISSGESSITSTFNNNKINNILKKIVKKFQLTGIINIQGIIKNKNIFIIDCNPRFGGASSLAIKKGFDIFYWQINELLNNKNIIDKNIFNQNSKITQVRYPSDLYINDINF